MENSERIKFIGAPGSPYSQKMLSLMRYRHIPYEVIWDMPENALNKLGIPKPKPVLLPVFLFDEGGELPVARCDSTPIIRELEDRYPERSVLPKDPALAFIDYLLEDFADEWMTKYMFHYRWFHAEDADNAGTLLPISAGDHIGDSDAATFKQFFTERQVSRLGYVGSNAVTAPIIEASYERFLRAMQAHLARERFLLGDKPAASDFAFYGQLTQLVGVDPTPRRLAHEISPRTVGWVMMLNDLSGHDAASVNWAALEDQPDTLRELLAECGRVYAPASLANAAAVRAGKESWRTRIEGQEWAQGSFPYQAKCLGWINEAYQALSAKDKARVDRVLDGTGCEAMLQGH